MSLSTEIFVLIISLIGFLLFTIIARSFELPARKTLLLAYFALLLSNVFTIVEEFYLFDFFNFLEHLMLAVSSIVFFIAVFNFTKPTASSEKPIVKINLDEDS